jgi:hypothetical protein
MKPGETIHLGDGAYLHFDGYSIEFRANHHEHPTDTVTVDGADIRNLIDILQATFET